MNRVYGMKFFQNSLKLIPEMLIQNLKRVQFVYIICFVALFQPNTTTFCQENSTERKDEKKVKARMLDSLNSRIQKIKYAEFTSMPSHQDLLLKGSAFPYSEFLLGIRDYLVNRLSLEIISSFEQLKKIEKEVSKEEIVSIYAETGEFNQKVGVAGNYQIHFSMKFSDGKEFYFDTKVAVNGITDYRALIFNTIEFQFPIRKQL